MPDESPDAKAEVPPAGDQLYVYPGVPPPVVARAEPLLFPQAGVVVIVAVIAAGCVTETVCCDIHPFMSVTVTV